MDCEFDKVKLERLWEALSRHGVSGHTFRVLQADKDVWCVPRIALESGNAGVDFQDGKRTLVDLSFADDILLFAKMFEETQFLLAELVIRLAQVGLQLSVRKTRILTTQSQSRCLYTSMAGMHVHSQYQQSHFTFGISPPCCVESVLCKDRIYFEQEY